MRNFVFFVLLFSSVVFAWAGGSSDSSSNADKNSDTQKVVNVYTSRHYDIDYVLFDEFTSKTNIKVNVIDGKANELVLRLEQEGQDTDMDILFLPEITKVSQAKNSGLLADISSFTESNMIADRVDPLYRDSHWVAVTVRARAIAYDKQNSMPKVGNTPLQTYNELAQPDAPSVLTRSATHPYNNAFIAYMISMLGEQQAATWVRGFSEHLARTPQGNDRDQMRAIIAGEGEIALVNTYYVHLLLQSDVEADRKVGERIGIILPDNTHVNVSAMAIGKYSKNREAAEAFISHYLAQNSQSKLTNENGEYPAVNDVEASELLRSWGDLKLSPQLTDLNVYQDFSGEAAKIADANGWN